MNIGRLIRTKRKGLGLTIQALSDETGVAVSTIANYESGRYKPTFDVLVLLLQGLQVEMSIDGKILTEG